MAVTALLSVEGRGFLSVVSHEVSLRSLGLWWSVLLTMGELHSCRFLTFFYSGSGELYTYSALARRMQTPFVAATTLRCFGAVEVEVSCSCQQKTMRET